MLIFHYQHHHLLFYSRRNSTFPCMKNNFVHRYSSVSNFYNRHCGRVLTEAQKQDTFGVTADILTQLDRQTGLTVMTAQDATISNNELECTMNWLDGRLLPVIAVNSLENSINCPEVVSLSPGRCRLYMPSVSQTWFWGPPCNACLRSLPVPCHQA